MALPSPGEIAAFLALAFVASFAYMLVRMRRESREQDGARVDAAVEIRRRAAAKGRRFEPGRGDVQWTQQGTDPAGMAWTLSHKVGSRESEAVNLATRSRSELDYTFGQTLVWSCPSLERKALAFALYRRTDDKPAPREVALGEHPAWWRWRVESHEPDLARRAFGPTAETLLEKLPLRKYANSSIDERTWIQLHDRGLVVEVGIDELTPDLVDHVIALGEAVAAGVRG